MKKDESFRRPHSELVVKREILHETDLENLSLFSFSADIEISVHEKDYIEVELYTFTNGPELKIRHEGGHARIEATEDKYRSSFLSRLVRGEREVTMSVALPSDIADVWEIANGSGDVFIQRIHAKRFQAKLQSGDLHIEDIKVQTALLETTSGDIHGNGMIAEEITCSNTSGSSVLRDIKAANLSGAANSGELNMRNVTCSHFRGAVSSGDIVAERMDTDSIDLACTSGDVKTKALLASRAVLNASSGDIRFSCLDNCAVHASATSGDITVFNQANEPDLQFSLLTSSGNIHTNIGKETYQYMNKCLKGIVGVGHHAVKIQTTSGDVELLVQ